MKAGVVDSRPVTVLPARHSELSMCLVPSYVSTGGVMQALFSIVGAMGLPLVV